MIKTSFQALKKYFLRIETIFWDFFLNETSENVEKEIVEVYKNVLNDLLPGNPQPDASKVSLSAPSGNKI